MKSYDAPHGPTSGQLAGTRCDIPKASADSPSKSSAAFPLKLPHMPKETNHQENIRIEL